MEQPTIFRVHKYTDGSVGILMNLGDGKDHGLTEDYVQRMLTELKMALEWYKEATGR